MRSAAFFVAIICLHFSTAHSGSFSDTSIVVTPSSITLEGGPGTRVDQPIQIKNLTAGSLTFTIAESTGTAPSRPSSFAGNPIDFRPFIRRIKEQSPTRPIPSPSVNPLTFTTAISDARGDNFLGGVDVLEVRYQKRTVIILGSVLDLQVKMVNPDSSVAGFISIDKDQDFGTGTWPTPWGLGPQARDIGSEFEVLVDVSGFVSDSLGFGANPIAVILKTTDTSLVYIPIFPTVTLDSVLTVTISGIPLGALGLNDGDGNLNIGAVFAQISTTPFPDYAPDIGHGVVGNETGVSWIRENQTNLTIASGDSASVDVSVLAAKPQGTYNASLKFLAQGQPPIYLPVQMDVTGLGTAAISLDITSITDTVLTSDSSAHTITISNTGTGNLGWSILDTSNTSWTSVAPSFGLISPGLSSTTTIRFHSAGLTADSTYRSLLLVVSNDLLNPSIVFPISLTVLPLTSVTETDKQLPTQFALHQNYPNPFNPETNIAFDLPGSAFVTLKLYNLIGQEVATIVNSQLTAGTHTYRVGSDNLASGLYLYRMNAGNFTQTKKMILIR